MINEAAIDAIKGSHVMDVPAVDPEAVSAMEVDTSASCPDRASAPAPSQGMATALGASPHPASQVSKEEAAEEIVEAAAREHAADVTEAEVKKEEPSAAPGESAIVQVKGDASAAGADKALVSTALPLPPTAELLQEACGWTVNGQIEVCICSYHLACVAVLF